MYPEQLVLPCDLGTGLLPQCERVLALQLTGGVPHHEGAVRSVPQFLVHFLSAIAIVQIRLRTVLVEKSIWRLQFVVVFSVSPGDVSPVPLGLCQEAAGVRHR